MDDDFELEIVAENIEYNSVLIEEGEMTDEKNNPLKGKTESADKGAIL